jgi:hypothetical protein
MTEQGPTQDSNEAPVLTGDRQTGSYTRPDDVVVTHEVTPDGMKQTRYSGGHRSAADFHVAAGVATPGEQAKVERVRQSDAQ